MSEAHRRFQDWLTAGAEGDPPRDLAVHASVCPSCRQSIAALDLLVKVDPGLATMPETSTATERGGLARAGRLTTAAAGVMFSAVILGIGASQLIALTRNGGGPVALASQTPNQGVLGSTATSQPSAEGSSTSPGETLTPLSSPTPTTIPTLRPSPRPRSSTTPTPQPTSTATSTATTTPTPTPMPTATPTPIPMPGTPTLNSPTWDGTGVQLTWNLPTGGPITNYEVLRSDTSGSGYGVIGSPTSTSFDDTSVVSLSTYYYVVRAVGDGGTGLYSTEQPITIP